MGQREGKMLNIWTQLSIISDQKQYNQVNFHCFTLIKLGQKKPNEGKIPKGIKIYLNIRRIIRTIICYKKINLTLQ